MLGVDVGGDCADNAELNNTRAKEIRAERKVSPKPLIRAEIT
jgi:hypothetical protein